MWYLSAPEHRPGWMRVDRLLGEHGLGPDTAGNRFKASNARQEFERRMEARRWAETDGEALKVLRRGWCLGGGGVKRQMLKAMEGKLGEHHSGELRRETAEAKAGRIVAEELMRLGWKENDLATRRKSDPGKLRIAARLRRDDAYDQGDCKPCVLGQFPECVCPVARMDQVVGGDGPSQLIL